jgi:hypothetical protein
VDGNMECKVEHRTRNAASSGNSGHDGTDPDMTDIVLYTSHHQSFPSPPHSSASSPVSLFHTLALLCDYPLS